MEKHKKDGFSFLEASALEMAKISQLEQQLHVKTAQPPITFPLSQQFDQEQMTRVLMEEADKAPTYFRSALISGDLKK